MSVTVTVTVETEEGGHYSKRTRTITKGGDNRRYNALNAELAIIEAGRSLAERIADGDGDIREDPAAPLSAAERRRNFD